jgi:hypothetical protein
MINSLRDKIQLDVLFNLLLKLLIMEILLINGSVLKHLHPNLKDLVNKLIKLQLIFHQHLVGVVKIGYNLLMLKVSKKLMKKWLLYMIPINLWQLRHLHQLEVLLLHISLAINSDLKLNQQHLPVFWTKNLKSKEIWFKIFLKV